MNVKDFVEFNLSVCSAEDIVATGSKVEDINLSLIQKLDTFAKRCPWKIILLKGGLTTGQHNSPLHDRGYAVDIAFAADQDKVKIYDLWKNAIAAGFHGVGIYWNGKAYSMHLDIREEYAFWAGRPNPLYNPSDTKSSRWTYSGIFLDPKI